MGQNLEKSLEKGSETRRRFPRREFGRQIGVLSGGQYVVYQGMEIGEGGLSFSHRESHNPGSLALVSFRVPGGDFLSLRIEVRSCMAGKIPGHFTGQFTIGAMFSKITFAERRMIRNYVSSRYVSADVSANVSANVSADVSANASANVLASEESS